MMNVDCDLCGTVCANITVFAVLDERDLKNYEDSHYYLCPKCAEKLHSFLDDDQKKEG